MFWMNYVKLCEQKGISPNKAAKEIGCSSGSVTAWSQGRLPRKNTLVKIAEYFNVSVDHLLDSGSSLISDFDDFNKLKAILNFVGSDIVFDGKSYVLITDSGATIVDEKAVWELLNKIQSFILFSTYETLKPYSDDVPFPPPAKIKSQSSN